MIYVNLNNDLCRDFSPVCTLQIFSLRKLIAKQKQNTQNAALNFKGAFFDCETEFDVSRKTKKNRTQNSQCNAKNTYLEIC